jgi:hypothetical protein
MTNNPNPQKYFIITAGPTGSGKTALVDMILEQLKINKPYNYTKFLIDDFVESDKIYIEAVSDITNKLESECKKNEIVDDNCMKAIFDNPSDDLLNNFYNAYSKARYSGCDVGCNAKLDNELMKLNAKKPDIVVFEITGINIPIWLLDESFIPHDYMIIFAYSLVKVDTLIQRNASRAYTGYKDFRKNKSKGFRLPNIKPKFLQETIETITKNLITLYNKCINVNSGDVNSGDVCGKKKISRLFVSNNNKDKHQLVFDSLDGDSDKLIEAIKSSIGNHDGAPDSSVNNSSASGSSASGSSVSGSSGGGNKINKTSHKKKPKHIKNKKRTRKG